MKPSFTLIILVLTACLLRAAPSAATMGYISLAVEDGITGGWTYPAGARSYLGDALLTADRKVYSLTYTPAGPNNISELTSSQQPIRAFPCDIDGDGYADLVIAYSDRQAVRMIIGRPGGSITADLLPGLNQVIAAGAARIDSDSLPDLLLADSSRVQIYTRVNPDSANGIEFRHYADLTAGIPASGHPLAISRILSGDYDGNQRIDFVYNGYVYINRGKGLFYSQQLPVPQGVIKLLEQSGDLDGDNRGELLWSSAGSVAQPVTVSIADYNSGSIFIRSIALESGLAEITRSFRYDANGDGLLELGLFSSAENRAVEFPGTAYGLNSKGRRELFSLDAPHGNFIGPLNPAGSMESDWLFHNPAIDSLYFGFALRPYADATVGAGLADSLAGVAAAVGDFNSDDLQDVYVINVAGNNALYRGEPGGKFTEVAVSAGVAQVNDGISCAWGDYNNDGFPDLIVAGLYLPDKLFINRGDGAFADSSQILRYNRGNQRATSVSWGDVNRDGWLDLVITNFDGPNWLLINRGGRYFENSAGGLGTTDTYYHTENAKLVDVNRDGWLDVVLLNDGGPTQLLMGGPGGQWIDATAASGLNSSAEYPKFGQSQSWGDFNGDGYPDLFITRAQDASTLFLNNGAGAQTRFNRVYSGKPGGGTYGRLASAIDDFDSDGRTDLLITRAELYGTISEIPKNQVYLGDPQGQGWPMIDAGESAGSARPGDALVATLRFNTSTSLPVAGDFDNDGDIDVLYVNYLPNNLNDPFHGSPLPLIFMRNESARSNSLTILLRRVDHSILAGTSVCLYYGGRTNWKSVSGGGGRIQTGPHLTFSLGAASSADSMKVQWADGVEQTLRGQFYSGRFELEADHTAPRLEFVRWPGNLAGGGTLVSSTRPLSGVLSVVENSNLISMLVIVRSPGAGAADTLRLADRLTGGRVEFSFAAPAPGDSLDYYCIATDTYGNTGRLPAGQNEYFRLKAEAGLLRGDIDGDLKVDINDVIALLKLNKRIADQHRQPTENEIKVGDLNSDFKLDIFDVLELVKLTNPGSNVQASFN